MNGLIFIALLGIVLALGVGWISGKRKGYKQGFLAADRRWTVWVKKEYDRSFDRN